MMGLFLASAVIAAVAVSFLTDLPAIYTFSLLPALALAARVVARRGAGLVLAIGVSAALYLGRQRLGNAADLAFPWIGAVWAGLLLFEVNVSRETTRRRASDRAQAALGEEARAVQKEIAFYEGRAAALSQRADLRRQLSGVAVELGSLLEPARIQEKLIAVAGSIFPGATVDLLGPHNAGASAPVFQRGQALLAADAAAGELSVMAAPVKLKRAVVAALCVSIPKSTHVLTADDVRLLDTLAGLASGALDNADLLEGVHQNAVRDGLTGLLTHRAFQDTLETAVLEASRYHKPMSLIMADIDHFKSVNDTHGHPAGDAVLQGFAHVMDRNLRDVDIVSRYGGEEFVILLYEKGYAEAIEVAEHIRADLVDQPFDIGGGATLSITASFGVASFPDDATSGQQLMRQADQRLYAAKRGGRNRVGGR